MQRINVNIRLIRRLLFRYTLVWVADAVSIAATAFLLPGIYFVRDNQVWYLYPFIVALLFGLLNALLRPILIVLLLPITFVTLGLATLGLNAALFYVMHLIVDAFVIDTFWAAVVGVMVLTLVNTLLGNLIQLGDDYSFYAVLMQKFSRFTRPKKIEPDAPGIVVLQIDGLSYRTVRQAIKRGYMPFMGALVKRREHVIQKWFSGVPSQTSSVLAGIFYGNSYDIPGYRWYDKHKKRLVVSSSSADMSAVDDRIGSASDPLLKDGTVINTLIHGNARKKILTISSLGDKDIKHHMASLEDFAIFSLHPYLYTRTILFMMWDFIVDRFERGLDIVRRKRPRVKRSIKFSFLRAVGNTFFRESATYFILEDIVRGIPIIYANYIGYDMVAHYGGPDSWDALRTLPAIDRQIKRIYRMISRRADKHYDLIVLSDHGQTRSVPFQELHGKTLTQVIEEKLDRPLVERSGEASEIGYFNTLLREIRMVERAYGTRPIRRSRRTLEHLQARIREETEDDKEDQAVVVCATGNLAHVYFTESTERLTAEDFIEKHPTVLESLVAHPGIGFVIMSSRDGEYLLMGKKGMRRLRSGEVEGKDPVLAFSNGTDAATLIAALAQLSAYPSSGDLIINGAILEDGRVVTFEGHRGTHGGVGGAQTAPFIVYPSRFRQKGNRPENPGQLYGFLRRLLRPTLV